jgi:hypothetical protein
VIAVIAACLAVWALVRPNDVAVNAAPSDKPTVCEAFQQVRKAVSIQTNADLGPDPVAQAAVAANARLAAIGGGQYLLSHLGPDTPGDLADAVRSFANNLLDVGVDQLAGAPVGDPDQAAWMSEAQKTSERVAEMCK